MRSSHNQRPLALITLVLTAALWAAAIPHGATSTLSNSAHAAPLLAGAILLAVDVAADRHAISPYIYGLHYTTEQFAAEIQLPVRRWGGNDTTRYNWQLDLGNNGSDFYFENNKTRDLSADQWVDRDRRTGTRTIMTMPMTGWVAKNDSQACGFSTTKYGAQQRHDTDNPARGYCGNGVLLNGSLVTGNDPHDTSNAITPTWDADWVQHFVDTYNTAANGGVLFYNLDNEPDDWHETHRDVHPSPLTYDEIRDRTLQHAPPIKATDPSAQTLGPSFSGWWSYFYSRYDLVEAAKNGYTSYPDREAHGNVPLVPWYLQQMQVYEQAHGTRPLDYLDLHFYPQNGVDLRDAGDDAMKALRLRSTRALWDPTYRDESLIGDDSQPQDMRYVRLIPRMREWVDNNYPGTKLALTEYNWGGLEDINGALAQADILGIFGREGLDLATLFDTPYGDGVFTPSSPGAFAFRMYRNFDGNGSTFGDVSVHASSGDQSQLAVYAAQRSGDGSLTIMVINKTGNQLSGQVALAGFVPNGSADVYRYSPANLGAIEQLPAQPVDPNGFTASFPANSITLFKLPSDAPVATATPTQTPESSPTPTPSPTTAVMHGRPEVYLPLVAR